MEFPNQEFVELLLLNSVYHSIIIILMILAVKYNYI